MFREEINEILLAPKKLIESLKKSEALSIGIILNLDKDNLFDKVTKYSELVNQEFDEGGIFNISKDNMVSLQENLLSLIDYLNEIKNKVNDNSSIQMLKEQFYDEYQDIYYMLD
jgi:hypothetical protein|nr:MAG TPA: hypothetical protein [Caudoviricetes sp.]